MTTKLTPNEEKAYKFVLSKEPAEVSIEDIADHIYNGETPPPHWRGTAMAIMRSIRTKTAAMRKRQVIRTSRLGRGSPALYAAKPKGKAKTKPKAEKASAKRSRK